MQPTFAPVSFGKGTKAPSATYVQGRTNNFDFLRFALATLVIFSHSFDLLHGRESNPIVIATRGQTELGSVAVDGFLFFRAF